MDSETPLFFGVLRVPMAAQNTHEPLYDDRPSERSRAETMAAGAELRGLAARRPKSLFMGCFGWKEPAWRGLIYTKTSGEQSIFSEEGLAAYAAHPLVNCLSLERGYYRPYRARELSALAACVPEHFRFLVRAPQTVTDVMLRDRWGNAKGPNPDYLNPDEAARFISETARGLGEKCGAVVFEMAPPPKGAIRSTGDAVRLTEHIARFAAEVQERNLAGLTLAVELRSTRLLTPRLLSGLKDAGVRYSVGLHMLMPGILRQTSALKRYEGVPDDVADWALSAPLIIRWSRSAALSHVNFRAGERLWASDPLTRSGIVSLLLRAAAGGQEAYLAVSDRAEGSAPRTLLSILSEYAESAAAARRGA
jgi:uncharacterized protein YecE (DUF72 family)